MDYTVMPVCPPSVSSLACFSPIINRKGLHLNCQLVSEKKKKSHSLALQASCLDNQNEIFVILIFKVLSQVLFVFCINGHCSINLVVCINLCLYRNCEQKFWLLLH